MATLDLGAYQLELVLEEVWELGLEYRLVLTCQGINVFAPWVPGSDTAEAGTLAFTADSPFDTCFRSLLTEEWPVRWRDDEHQWITVVGYPASFRYALEMREPAGHNELFWGLLGDAAKDRYYDRFERNENEPKHFKLQRAGDEEHVRLNFRFHPAMLRLRRGLDAPTTHGDLAFEAYVHHDALKQFLDRLEQERKPLEAQMKKGEEEY